MDKPRIFLGSSSEQLKLVQARDARSRGRRARGAVDDLVQPGDQHAGASRRAHASSRLRGLRFRAGRLDHEPPAGICRCGFRSGFSARQRDLRSGALRGDTWNAANIHPASEGRQAADRSARPHVRPVRIDDAFRDADRRREAAEGDRERGKRRPHRGPVVAVLPLGTRFTGAFRREPSADLARPRTARWRSSVARGRRTAGCRRDTGAKP
jgi:hypothetical protein